MDTISSPLFKSLVTFSTSSYCFFSGGLCYVFTIASALEIFSPYLQQMRILGPTSTPVPALCLDKAIQCLENLINASCFITRRIKNNLTIGIMLPIGTIISSVAALAIGRKLFILAVHQTRYRSYLWRKLFILAVDPFGINASCPSVVRIILHRFKTRNSFI